MDVVEDNARREALAQRMSKLLGLPITNIQLLMPLISRDELEKLENLPDDQFLSQATKIINTAQKRQFEEDESPTEQVRPAASPTEPTIKPMGPVAAPVDPLEDEDEVQARPKSRIGRKGAKAASAEAEDAEAAAPDMPSVFQRPTKKGSMFSDKRTMLMIVGGAVAAAVILGCAIFLAMALMADPSHGRPAPVVANPGGDDPDAPATQALVYTNDWALKMQSTFDIHVTQFTPVDGATTIEFWVKPLAGMGEQELLISGEGAEETLETFRLSFARTLGGDFETQFAVPSAGSKAATTTIPAEAQNHWLHVAGVFDPLTTGKLYLYISGMQVASESTNGLADLKTDTYRIISTASGEAPGFLLDEVRLTNAPLYLGDFRPRRLYGPQGDTVSLLHFEKWDDDLLRDAGARDRTFSRPGGELVYIADEVASPVIYELQLAPIPFPAELLDELEKRKGKLFVLNFTAEWEDASRSDRIAYLRSLRYPEERLAALMAGTQRSE